MTRGKLARVAALEVAHAVRGTGPEDPARVALVEEARALLCALPASLRGQVEAHGARGVAELLERSWEVRRGEGEDLGAYAVRLHALAFPGGRA